MTLKKFFSDYPKAALAFSGGTDSAYLLYAGLKCGADIRPYYIKTSFQPQFELDDAERLAEQLGVKLTIIELDVLSHDEIKANPANRCYFCKTALFTALQNRAKTDGYSVLLDGTNASDDASDRPGMKALRELSVLSPLRLCGLTKDEIRNRSQDAGLFTWNKPAYACLATRIPTGCVIDEETLRNVEHAESALFRLGFADLRVRVFHGAARLQVPAAQMETAVRLADDIKKSLRPYFDTVLLDLNGR